jgi:glycosyltransferase involved in cell wall biosynthesis
MRGAPLIESYLQRLDQLAHLAHRSDRTTRGAAVQSCLGGPLLSVITATFNAERTLERTLRSVIVQSHPYIEYIVIDGGSSDRSTDILRTYSPHIAYWHSNRDNGISDAFNLGIAASRGRYVAIVGADDWMSPTQGALAVAALESSGAAFAFGRLAYHALDGRQRYVMEGRKKYWHAIRYRMPEINHPTVVVRRESYLSIGLFDLRWRIAMDYDWHLRAELAGLRGVYVPELLGHMTEGGTCFLQWPQGLREVRDASILHGSSALIAQTYYASRLVRGHARLALRRILPHNVVDRVHRAVNPRYYPSS